MIRQIRYTGGIRLQRRHVKLNRTAYGGRLLTSVSGQKRLGGRRTGAARDVILATLARNADNAGTPGAPSAGTLSSAASRTSANIYYTLTRDELTALARGNVKQIERWVGKLDKSRARWLWNRLSERP